MAMQLIARPANRKLSGKSAVAATAGQSIKIETAPGGEEVLNVVCPTGKKWVVNVTVDITEHSV